MQTQNNGESGDAQMCATVFIEFAAAVYVNSALDLLRLHLGYVSSKGQAHT